jgi:hypothetical protein
VDGLNVGASVNGLFSHAQYTWLKVSIWLSHFPPWALHIYT